MPAPANGNPDMPRRAPATLTQNRQNLHAVGGAELPTQGSAESAITSLMF
jgi:hypothetical protein